MKRLHGTHVKKGATKADMVERCATDIRKFKKEQRLRSRVAVWCGSTEIYIDAERGPPSRSTPSKKGSLKNDPGIANSQIYAWALHQGGRPLRQRRAQPDASTSRPRSSSRASSRCPIAGKDFKTGQTLMKTVVAPGLKARMLGLSRLVLDQHPRQPRRRGARRSRELQDRRRSRKLGVLEHILQPQIYPELYGDIFHKVRIEYYPPRGDAKEGWDNIDIFGWLGYPMQIKINFLCRDSILAAPHRARSRAVHGPRAARRLQRHAGVAQLLFQEPDDRAAASTPSTISSSSR